MYYTLVVGHNPLPCILLPAVELYLNSEHMDVCPTGDHIGSERGRRHASTHERVPCRSVYAGKETYVCTTNLIAHILKTCDAQFNILAHESNGAQRIYMAYPGDGINMAVDTREESMGQ